MARTRMCTGVQLSRLARLEIATPRQPGLARHAPPGIPPRIGPGGSSRHRRPTIGRQRNATVIVLGFVLLRRKRLIENLPTSRIRSVAMGFAELAGRAKFRTALSAPFSGIPCAYFCYLVEQEKTRSRGGRTWETIDRGESGEPFHLQDPTGTILVDPAGAGTVLRRSFRKIDREGSWGTPCAPCGTR